MSAWLDAHRDRLDAAVRANRIRDAHSPFIETPSRRAHEEGTKEAATAAFEALLGQPFDLELPGVVGTVGGETSPFTAEPLGIDYPRCAPDALMEAAVAAWPAWRDASVADRVGVCLEILHRWSTSEALFLNALATQHTAGQAYMLSFAGSGASSLDRGLEALAMAWSAMQQLPTEARFTRKFGGDPVTLRKRYRLMPVGVAVVLSCGSYPAWNAWPAVMANLATGNPVVLKPHPDTILPMAIGVRVARQVLTEAGFDPNLITLAVDTWDAPVATALLDHPAAAIVDFTGGQRFGAHLERSYPQLQVYTETAGCNAVVVESADDLDAVLGAVATGLVMFSGQMCTTPQNLWIPPSVRDGDRAVPRDEVVRRLIAAVDAIVASPKHVAGLAGALHSARTLDDIASVTEAAGDRVLRPSAPYDHPTFPQARTATPLIVGLEASDRSLAQEERFGPVAFVIRAADREEALAGATADAKQFGAIASYAYTVDEGFLAEVEDRFAVHGASVGINLVRQRPMQFTAAFSDYHVTGLNPAGTACLTDPAFVTRRFRIVQSKREL